MRNRAEKGGLAARALRAALLSCAAVNGAAIFTSSPAAAEVFTDKPWNGCHPYFGEDKPWDESCDRPAFAVVAPTPIMTRPMPPDDNYPMPPDDHHHGHDKPPKHDKWPNYPPPDYSNWDWHKGPKDNGNWSGWPHGEYTGFDHGGWGNSGKHDQYKGWDSPSYSWDHRGQRYGQHDDQGKYDDHSGQSNGWHQAAGNGWEGSGSFHSGPGGNTRDAGFSAYGGTQGWGAR
jgi:hypothetical protein